MTTNRAPWSADLHVRLSRRYALESRATRGAVAALVVSLLAWVLGLSPAAHGLAMAIAAAAGALLPVRPPLHQAFGWIGRHAGLAYQTHVEHGGRPDPYGFLAATEVQARLSVRGVAPPPHRSWWLPMAAGAVGVWLVASAVGGLLTLPGIGAPATEGPPPGGAQTPPPLVAPEEPDPVMADEAEDAPEPDAPTPPGPPQDPAAQAEDAPAGSEAGGGADPLDRFLDNLRERPRDTEDGGVAQAERTAGRDGVRDDTEPAGQLEERRDDTGDAAATLRPTEEDAGDAEAEEGPSPAPGEGEGDGEEVELPATEGGDGEEGPDGPPGDGAGEEGTEPGTEPGGDEAPEGAPGEAPAEGDDAPFEAGDGDEAGAGVGRPDDREGADPGAPEGPEESLSGLLLSGEETPGGRVRLPGRDGAVVPDGVPVERYERAVEQAIIDGAVPVPYQEIIRNYFR